MDSALDNLFESLSASYRDTPFEVELWDGAKKQYGRGAKKFTFKINDKNAVGRILTQGSLGFGEEYMKGNIEIDGDLQAVIKLGNSKAYSSLHFPLLRKIKLIYDYAISRDTIRSAKNNISRHYDIGNDFYQIWLDKTLTYSCAYFKNESDDLEQAQMNKYDHLCKKMRLKAGDRLVDIGCGWGGMMFYAARKYGAVCTGYTLSKNQYDYVVEAIARERLEDKVKIELKDYREAEGVFDKFVSIGMFEHVGKEFYGTFFDTVKKILKPEGIGVLHHIGTIEDRPTDPWVTKYIFPGGWLPTLPVVTAAMTEKNLVFYDIEDLRMHYAMTLDRWTGNFEANLDGVKKALIAALKDKAKVEEFVRMWRLYLNGSSSTFKYGTNRLYQITFSNGLNNNLPLTREYIYG